MTPPLPLLWPPAILRGWRGSSRAGGGGATGGATVVSLTQDTARQLSIFPLPEDYTATMRTANGVVRAAPVTLREVRLGTISVRQVKAVVMPDRALGTNLLGMSFLGHLSSFTVGNDEMVLRQ